MAKQFPLYDILLERTKDPRFQAIDTIRVCRTLSDLPIEHAEIIYALILHHEILHSKGVRFRNVPYNGNVLGQGKGVHFTITNLPPILQQIIILYISKCQETS